MGEARVETESKKRVTMVTRGTDDYLKFGRKFLSKRLRTNLELKAENHPHRRTKKNRVSA